MALPRGFIDVRSAYQAQVNTKVNIVGVVLDIRSPTQAKTGQWMVTFKLSDKSIHDYLAANALTVRFFKEDSKSLPDVRQHGDVVLLRNINMMMNHGQPVATSNYSTRVLVFPFDTIPSPEFQIAYQDRKRLDCLGVPLDVQTLTLEEQAYVIQLKQQMLGQVEYLRANAPSPPENAPQGAARLTNLPAAPPYKSMAPAPPVNAPRGPAALLKRSAGVSLPLDEPQAKRFKVSSFGPKFRTISEVQAQQFVDLCVLVVKKFPTHYGGCELYVTDYTANKELYYYAPPEEEQGNGVDGDAFHYTIGPGEKRQFPGPFGHLVLKLELRHPHAEFVNHEVEVGQLVFLQNVRIKTSNIGKGNLEGNMWQDSLNREKIQVKILRDKDRPEIHALFERQDQYWAAREAKVGARQTEQGNKKKTSRTEKKKQRKAAKAAKAAEEAQKASGTSIEGALTIKAKVTINPHVRCGHQEVSITPLTEILDPSNERHTNTTPEGQTYILPFINAKYRARVRVIDFAPKTLEDFACQASPSQQDTAGDDDSVVLIDYDASPSYSWSFSLLLEDCSKPPPPKTSTSAEGAAAATRLWATVGHTEAQYLFGNDVPDPGDLRQDRKLLAQVREKLCILWGNLEEKGEGEAVSNVPFECCLMEFGVDSGDDRVDDGGKISGWERGYRMCGVTIS